MKERTNSEERSGDRFDVYVTADVFIRPRMSQTELARTPYSKENASPLTADEAVELFKRCMMRVSMGRVFVVCLTDDTVALDWNHADGYTFPKDIKPVSLI